MRDAGEPAPAFRLKDLDGRERPLEEPTVEGPVLLAFSRPPARSAGTPFRHCPAPAADGNAANNAYRISTVPEWKAGLRVQESQAPGGSLVS